MFCNLNFTWKITNEQISTFLWTVFNQVSSIWQGRSNSSTLDQYQNSHKLVYAVGTIWSIQVYLVLRMNSASEVDGSQPLAVQELEFLLAL